ncbi:MAG: hypothetical protein JWM95_190 [Gemmatimonadetes bacterium]|nr:hypothetical protein [Gemmatimonadota bacterium]
MKKAVANRFRRATSLGTVALGLGGLIAMSACGVQDSLLEQQQPQIIVPEAVASSTGALGLYTGALGRFRTSLNGGDQNTERIWNFAGLMTDEFKAGDTFSQRIDADQRATQSFDVTLLPQYNALQQSRGFARTAINSLISFAPDSGTKIGEMFLEVGFFEATLAQDFCNGIPLGQTVEGIPQYTEPLTNAAIFALAVARYDSGTTYVKTADAAAVNIKNALLVAKARAQVNLGQFAAAATTVASVPTTYAYLITYSQPTQSNEWWQMATAAGSKRYAVGDSVDSGGLVGNSLPFASVGDTRVKVTTPKSSAKSFDNLTPLVEFLNYGREEPVALVNGIDARLIEAEAKLQASDYPGMTTILNALRTPGITIGKVVYAAMPALTAPATKDAAIDLFFREKAFWQFGRGERLSDLRRLVRQYGRTQDKVFPSGQYYKAGTYGTNVAFPVPDAEAANPNFHGCLDKNA